MATTRDIRTTREALACDVCGRTLLTGERTDTWIAGASRRQVCDLCTARAIHDGWVREGTELETPVGAPAGERRRSLLSRWRQRGRRGPEGGPAEREAPPELAAAEPERPPPPAPPAAPRPAPAPREPAGERRQVRAVPTRPEQRTTAALEIFNASEHTRTVAGVARSLGLPVVAARADGPGSRVTITVSWELCWYRYAVELGDDLPGVQQESQGYELTELEPADRLPNAAADEYGRLHPASAG